MAKSGVVTGDMEKYWKAALDNPEDFNAWTYLLAYTEHVNNIEESRKAFEIFLGKWPYCYGYWNRYADVEKRSGSLDKARTIYENGAAATPLSIDLWLHYINFETVQQQGKPGFEDLIRKLYRRAADSAGLDFKSDKLWDAFITWESSHSPTNALQLYDELLKIPTQNISKHFEGMKRLINQHKPRELIGPDEIMEHHLSAFGNTPSEEAGESSAMETDGGADAVKAKVDQLMNSLTAEQLKTIRNQMIQKREVVFKQTLAELEKRKHFEENIRRPYFHIKALEPGQLTTWREYTDFEMKEGDHNRIAFLFERCLVACALYEEFWLKYVTYLMKHDPVMTSKVYERACTIHLTKKPFIHLAWAAFEESKNDVKKAAEVLDLLDKKIPNLAMVQTRRINLYRRAGMIDEVKRHYSEAIKSSQTANGATFFACKCARYLHLVLGDVDAARQVLEAEIANQNSNPRLYLQLLDLELSVSDDERERRVTAILDRAIAAMITTEDRVIFSQRKMEFLEDFGQNTTSLFQAYERHQVLLKDAALDLKHKLDSEVKTGDVEAKKPMTTAMANENVQPKSSSLPATKK